MKKTLALILVALMLTFCLFGCAAPKSTPEKIQIKALVLPKFEEGEMSGDFPGEAQYYYEEYCSGGEEYEVAGGVEGHKLYVKDGVALYLTGMGKVNSALSAAAVLSDSRFDFSNAYVISTGCAGGAYGYGVMGDVFVVTAAVDFDLGHRADVRDLGEQKENAQTWFHDESYDNVSCKILNPVLTQKVYDLVKDVKVSTTEKTRRVMGASFNNEQWATRDPKVLKGTAVTSDSYWKGIHEHNTAEYVVKNYNCPDPYGVSEMEDVGIAAAVERAGMLDRYIILRDVVNMDVFMNGDTPESLWDPEYIQHIGTEEHKETADIFATARENNFLVGKVVIDAILSGKL